MLTIKVYLDDKAALVLKKVNNPQDFGVAVLENSKIVDLIEKPKKLYQTMQCWVFINTNMSVLKLLIVSKSLTEESMRLLI